MEYRVYCDICDKLCKERIYKNHLKSPSQTNNIRKKILYKKMNYFRNLCDKTIKLKSKNNHFNTLTHKEFDRCEHLESTIENPDIEKIDNSIYGYVIQHNKKCDYYVVKCQFKLVFNNSQYCFYVMCILPDKKTIIPCSTFVEKIFNDFKNNGY